MDLVEHQNKSTENRHPWELARFEVVYSFISKHFKSNEQINILDIGCGDTFVVSQLHKKMPQSACYAIDTAFSNEMINDFQQDGIQLFQNLNHINGIVEKAQLILLMDVIEHIEDDKAFLKDLINREFIDENTLFLITVPAYQALFSSHDVFLKHYRRYSRKRLNLTLKNTGFDIIESGYFFTSLLAPRLLSLAKEKIKKDPDAKGLAGWNGSKKQSNILKEVLYLDFKTTSIFQRLGVKLPGLSTYALCRKSVS